MVKSKTEASGGDGRAKPLGCERTRTAYSAPSAIGAIMGSGSPYSVWDMDWTEDDTVNTTMNGISNITFIKRRQTRVSN